MNRNLLSIYQRFLIHIENEFNKPTTETLMNYVICSQFMEKITSEDTIWLKLAKDLFERTLFCWIVMKSTTKLSHSTTDNNNPFFLSQSKNRCKISTTSWDSFGRSIEGLWWQTQFRFLHIGCESRSRWYHLRMPQRSQAEGKEPKKLYTKLIRERAKKYLDVILEQKTSPRPRRKRTDSRSPFPIRRQFEFLKGGEEVNSQLAYP